jgi:DNA-directed RNA polymerase delta subunit
MNLLEVMAGFAKNAFDKWGLFDWKEINPKGTREKIYIVLKERNKPLHFVEIAEHIDKYQLSKKKAHPQTVHNELIKDDRFVLIGRGIYALKEWGYQEGTVKDILKDILKKSKKPLTKDEILEQVFKMRKVKKSTVMINLNNSLHFMKEKNQYSIK